ncbi:MarR family transcriptional regulator [Halodesulfovibrio sp.]|uniref:MarR family winged helix-turn-helix transcriptional regulator n=1 Tax=Halodesulfovibrio sp. TaxID=1912772 RepID=UPI0025D98531|nr:MarR family transcriptional regulator [Halodesulfovibrio sp.]MCT4535032.1 MarR family transcriptional regulator [Halodesulfovibrio sp.]
MKNIQNELLPLPHAIAMVNRMQAAKAKDKITDFNLTFSQIPFLMKVIHYPTALTQDQLSKMLFIDPAATARAIEQLEKKGLVTRNVNPDNRRQKLISATEKAHCMSAELRSALCAATQEILEPLKPEEQTMLAQLLTKICEYGIQG